ncbi:hypothetical protein EYB26_001258 [Talaromyces marneffei]|uniref:uncharacterized protein n=1 Tax=Talaromyces marneffei TaxID=37727 RepID=UPI0012A90669|nr:uncharacterized protein EYB26_001258 [Talaromyces marneffei]QGA13608.1 hypothetical protein EYB26_001258 [Talaromyces marneffei]
MQSQNKPSRSVPKRLRTSLDTSIEADLIGAKPAVSRGPLSRPKAARLRHAKPATRRRESRLINSSFQLAKFIPLLPFQDDKLAHPLLPREQSNPPRVYVRLRDRPTRLSPRPTSTCISATIRLSQPLSLA